MSNAIAIASTMSAGVGANHGTMSKPLNMSWAAENGVTAARFAALGMDGPVNALEAGRGFFEAFGGGYNPSKIIRRMGDPWAIVYPGTSIKPYPSGVVGHPGMDTMKKPVEPHDIRPEAVERIEVKTGANVIDPGPSRIQHARTELKAKFGVSFQMAAIVLRRKAGLAEFSDAFVPSPECQEMQTQVTAELDPEIVAMGKGKIVARISLTTKDGRSYFAQSDPYYRGGPKKKKSEKFRDAVQGVLSAEKIDAFLLRGAPQPHRVLGDRFRLMPRNDSSVRGPQGTTQKIAEYLTSVAGQALPEEVALKTKCHIVDSLAAVISGSRLKAGRLAAQFIATQGGTPEATVWGTDIRTTAINAALTNGIDAHPDETDDSHLEGRFHPGCAVIPAAFAVGEARGQSGQAVLNAVAAGYDIGARFSMALGVSGPRTATHSTDRLGALFGAAGAASALMDFTTEGACSAEHLSGQGCIWMLSGLEGTSSATRRQQAALSVFSQFPGIQVEFVSHTDWTPEGGYRIVGRLLDDTGRGPDGIWCDSGLQGVGSVQQFLDRGLPIPAHTGGDLNRMYKLCLERKVPMVALDYPASMGARALEVALDILSGQTIPQRVEVPVQIILPRGLESQSVKADVWAERHVAWDLPDDAILSQGPALRPLMAVEASRSVS